MLQDHIPTKYKVKCTKYEIRYENGSHTAIFLIMVAEKKKLGFPCPYQNMALKDEKYYNIIKKAFYKRCRKRNTLTQTRLSITLDEHKAAQSRQFKEKSGPYTCSLVWYNDYFGDGYNPELVGGIR